MIVKRARDCGHDLALNVTFLRLENGGARCFSLNFFGDKRTLLDDHENDDTFLTIDLVMRLPPVDV